MQPLSVRQHCPLVTEHIQFPLETCLARIEVSMPLRQVLIMEKADL